MSNTAPGQVIFALSADELHRTPESDSDGVAKTKLFAVIQQIFFEVRVGVV
jgi:hypothetical protein